MLNIKFWVLFWVPRCCQLDSFLQHNEWGRWLIYAYTKSVETVPVIACNLFSTESIFEPKYCGTNLNEIASKIQSHNVYKTMLEMPSAIYRLSYSGIYFTDDFSITVQKQRKFHFTITSLMDPEATYIIDIESHQLMNIYTLFASFVLHAFFTVCTLSEMTK